MAKRKSKLVLLEEEQPIVPVDNFDDLELCEVHSLARPRIAHTPNEAFAITKANKNTQKTAFIFRPYKQFVDKYDLKTGNRLNLYTSSVRNKAYLVIKDDTGMIELKKYAAHTMCISSADFSDRLAKFYNLNFNSLGDYKLDLIRVTNEKGEPVFRNGGLLFEIDLVKVKQDG